MNAERKFGRMTPFLLAFALPLELSFCQSALALERTNATDTAPGWGWGAFILPYLEQGALHGQLNFSQPVQKSPAIQTMCS